MKLQDLENIEDYYIDEGFLCIKLISGDHLRINFNSIESIKKQFSIPDVSHQRELLKALKKNHLHNFGNTPISIEELDDYIESL
tara:strand:+ start:201 stop:452 length:252 start_codon:yes stop_codon:yes gene_type:complete